PAFGRQWCFGPFDLLDGVEHVQCVAHDIACGGKKRMALAYALDSGGVQFGWTPSDLFFAHGASFACQCPALQGKYNTDRQYIQPFCRNLKTFIYLNSGNKNSP